jgi:hypothetical protein
VTPGDRVSLHNMRLTRRHADGRVEEVVLAGSGDLGRVLAEDFHLDPPADAGALFARLPSLIPIVICDNPFIASGDRYRAWVGGRRTRDKGHAKGHSS